MTRTCRGSGENTKLTEALANGKAEHASEIEDLKGVQRRTAA